MDINNKGIKYVNFNTQFLGGYIICDLTICDKLLDYFKEQKKLGKTNKGTITLNGRDNLNKKIKDSTELSFNINDQPPCYNNYIKMLQLALNEYIKEYHFCNEYGAFSIIDGTNLQVYPIGGGYKIYHTERSNNFEPITSRHLVFMTYLNDVSDKGETEFYYQKIKVKPKKGLTLIWPADWTFTHRGIPSPTQEKAIITGWYNYIN
tara:strand:- start:1096 stop:1713 length:618 start_codon:yes stop_codon:yes gene_type:complete